MGFIQFFEIKKEQFFDELKRLLLELIEDALKKHSSERYVYEDILTREKTAELLKISFPCLNDWDKDGTLPAYRLGRRVYYFRSEVEKLLRSSRTQS